MRAAWKQRGVLIKNSSSLDEVSFGRDLRSPSLPLSSLLFSRVVREKTFLRSSLSRLQTSLSKPSASISSQRLRGSLRCFRRRKGEGARFPGLTSSPILTFATSAKKNCCFSGMAFAKNEMDGIDAFPWDSLEPFADPSYKDIEARAPWSLRQVGSRK